MPRAAQELIDELRSQVSQKRLPLEIPDDISLSDAQDLIVDIEKRPGAFKDGGSIMNNTVKREPGPVMKTIGALTDTVTGVARAGLASAMAIPSTLAGYQHPVGPEDLYQSAIGQGPSSTEYYRRTGLPEGKRPSQTELLKKLYSETGDEWFKWKRGGLFDPSPAAFATTAADLFLSPKTARDVVRRIPGEGLLARIGKSTAAGELPNDLLHLGSKKGFSYTLSGLDKANTIRKGRSAITPDLFERGIWGTDETIMKKISKWADELQVSMSATEDKVKKLALQAHREGREVHPHDLDEVLAPVYAKARHGLDSQSPEGRKRAADTIAYLDTIYSPGSFTPKGVIPGKPDPFNIYGGYVKPDQAYPAGHAGGYRQSDIDEMIDLTRREQNFGSKAYENTGTPTALAQQDHADIGNAARPYVQDFMGSKKATDLGLTAEEATKYLTDKELLGRLLNAQKPAISQAMRGNAAPSFFAGTNPYTFIRGALPTWALTGAAQLGRGASGLGIPSAVTRYNLLEERDSLDTENRKK